MFFLNSVRVAPGVPSAVAFAACVAVCSLAMPGSAWSAEPVSTLEPVVVTATRAETPLQLAPVGATIVTALDMQRAGVQDANEAVRRLGGVAARTDLSGGRDHSLSPRGYGATADMNLVVLIDGIRANEAQLVSARLSAIPIDQIERIEIVRGGQSVLWGAGASAGVINVILKQGRPKGLHGLASVAIESFDGVDGSLSLSQAWDKVWVEANAKRLNTKGYRDNGDYHQEVDGLQVSGLLGEVRLHARAQQERQTSGLPGYLTFQQFAQNPRQSRTPSDHGLTDETQVSGGLSWQGQAWGAKFDIASRSRHSAAYYSGYDIAWDSHTDLASPAVTYRTRWDGIGSLEAVAGLDWQRWSLTNTGYGQFSEQTNQALFTQLNWNLVSKTRVNMGLRHETADSATAYSGFSTYDHQDHLHAWELGVSQTVWPHTDVYGRVARSYRLATADEYGYTATFAPLRPQYNRDAELGVKWSEAGKSATLRWFRQGTVDEIDYDPIARANANLPALRRRGLELDARWVWSGGWSAQLTAQALTAKFTDGPLAGKQVPLVANRTATARVSHEFNEQHSVSLGAQYLSAIRFNDDVDNTCARRIPSSTLLDARYQWTDQVWTASLGVTNLADRSVYNMAYKCSFGALYPEAGRVWRATLSRRF
jgi:iron complex outermembrane recepter protein